jgi:hypothetical protein
MHQKNPPTASSSEVFYHALYHHITHWAAFVAMMALLITIGFILSLTPIPKDFYSGRRTAGVFAAVVAGLAGAIYFAKGMDTYGALVNERLPKDYLEKVWTFPHKTTIALQTISAFLCAIWDIVLLLILSPR